MEFVFQITQYNSDALEDEVAAALEKRLELNSRKILPAMWRFIDWINSWRASKRVIKQRKILSKIYGIILVVMGIYLLVPGLIHPRELLVPLIAGIIGVLTGVGCIWPWKKQSNHKFHKIAEEPLAGMRKQSNRKFHKIAKELLAGLRKPLDESTETPLLVRFTVEGMSFLDNSLITYQDFQTIIEGESIYFLVWLNKVTILQKKDLVVERQDAFLAFLEEMTSLQRITVVPNKDQYI